MNENKKIYDMMKNDFKKTNNKFGDCVETMTQAKYDYTEQELNPAYKENLIIEDIRKYILGTYDEHYVFGEGRQLFDDWIEEGNANITFRHTAQKYLKRYGIKDGKNKKDIMKAVHFLVLLLYVDHYHDIKKNNNE